MILTFRIHYRTQWGEVLAVKFDERPATGSGQTENIILSTADGELWEGSFDLLDATPGETIRYHYCVMRDDETIRIERGTLPHVVCIPAEPEKQYRDLKEKAAGGLLQQSVVILSDAWRDLPVASYLFTSAFSGKYEVEAPAVAVQNAPKCSITIRVVCPCLHQQGRVLGLVGEGEALGEWQRPLVFTEIMPNHWQLSLNIYQLTGNSQYKFVAVAPATALQSNASQVPGTTDSEQATGTIVEWETGENRRLYVPQLDKNVHYNLPEVELYLPSSERKIAGTAVPVFSLRSEGSQGVGDFGDLKMLIDWAVKTGQRAIQILPINDTTMTGTWKDSYPYNSISIYAFHPMYVDLRAVGPLIDKDKEQKFQKKFRQLNALPQIDYEAVNKAKRDYLLLAFREKGEKVMQTKAYKDFYKKNEDWLLPYAAYSVLRDKFGTSAFKDWPEYSTYNAQEIKMLCRPEGPVYQSVCYYVYIQYLLHVQLLEASAYAREHCVIFKGDIPIGVSRTSIEAWVEPYYFNMNGQAGAPPDAFSTTGQNWGFPTYNWDVMKEDGYRWWKRRFSKMAEYFTCYRIDHILGFFRIWEIQGDSVQGMLGQFSPSLPMTEEEIRSFGLNFQKDFMTKPFICDEILSRVFGEHADFVKGTFLTHSHYDIWQLRPEYRTQRNVQAWFEREGGRMHDAEKVRDGMFTLINNVLFLHDNKESGVYHPRITAHESLIFERLSHEEREAYMRLYNHYYYERHNKFWYEKAMEKLPQLLEAAPMLACGEDLGMVPDCVPWVMNELQIISLEIERMPKDPHYEIGHVWEYPLRSVCTIGTHDMSTFRGWWKEDPALTTRYYHETMWRGGDVPAEAPGWVCEDVVKRHLESPSLLTILALQDWIAMDEKLRLPDTDAERINVPANPRHYWRYRMHISLESLLRQDAFNDKVKTMIQNSQR